MIKPFFEVSNRDELVARDGTFNIIGIRDKEELPHSDLVQLAVVNDHSATAFDCLIGCILLRRESWEAPVRRSLLKLTPLHIFLNSLLDPFGIRTVEAEELASYRWASSDKPMLKSFHSSAG